MYCFFATECPNLMQQNTRASLEQKCWGFYITEVTWLFMIQNCQGFTVSRAVFPTLPLVSSPSLSLYHPPSLPSAEGVHSHSVRITNARQSMLFLPTNQRSRCRRAAIAQYIDTVHTAQKVSSRGKLLPLTTTRAMLGRQHYAQHM